MAASNGVRSREVRASVAGFFALTVAAVVAARLQWHQAAICFASLGAYAAGVLAWIAAVERRLPWPFGPRAPASKGSWPEYRGVVLMITVFTFGRWPLSVYVSPSTGLGTPLPGFEGRVNVLQVPAGAAATLIAGFASLITAPLIVRFVAEAHRLVPLGRRRRASPRSGSGDIPAR